MKIFLCHSSEDNNYVRDVARRLGRDRIVFDEISFLPGQDFRESINKGLDKSDTFVLFASLKSLQSTWCQYEIEEIQYRRIHQKIENILCVIIDRQITMDHLPSWLKRSKIIQQYKPIQTAREISNIALSQVSFDKTIYIGRDSITEKFTSNLSNHRNENNSYLFCISGLEGIGRKTFLRRILRDALTLNLGPFLPIDQTRTFEDLYLLLLDENLEPSSKEFTIQHLNDFKILGLDKQITELCKHLTLIIKDGNVPCFIDEGGMLSETGEYRKEFILLFQELLVMKDAYVAALHIRRPFIENMIETVPVVKVDPLDRLSMSFLIERLFKVNKVIILKDQIDELTNYLDGYPPAAYMALKIAKDYGTDVLMRDKSQLEDFKARLFTRFLEKLKLNEKEWKILGYLASEEAIPLSVFNIALKIGLDEVAMILKRFIDLCIVVPIGNNYIISGPLRTAVHRSTLSNLTTEEYKEIKDALTSTYWNDNKPLSIEIIDATLHAVARSGETNLDQYQSLMRFSTVMRLANESYHHKEYDAALAYSDRAIALDSARLDAKIIKFKSLVRQEEWPRAESVLSEIKTSGDKKIFYLNGFLLWKQKKYPEAIKQFETALKIGDGANSVYRDLAECLYRVGRYEDAFDKIKVVQDRDPGNIFILDLLARIFIDSKNISEAEKYILLLESADREKMFIHHRKSRYYSLRKDWKNALKEAEEARETCYAPFETYVQRADSLIEMRDFTNATEAIDEIRRQYPKSKRDIQKGLNCKLLLRQLLWKEAEIIWYTIEKKDIPIAQGLHYQILLQKSEDINMQHHEREEAKKELESIDLARITLNNYFDDSEEDADELEESDTASK